MIKQYQKEFIEFALENNALKFGEFTLKSGRISPYFFNAGVFASGEKIKKVGEFYAAALQAANIEYDVLFGPAYKGIPLAASTAIALTAHYHIDKSYCFNRKETKEHGEGGNMVGAALAGRIMIIDDVITAGTAIKEAATLIAEAKAHLCGITIALARQERGKSALSAIQEVEDTYKTKVISIINLENLIEYLADQAHHRNDLQNIFRYREQYGILNRG